MRLRSLAVLPLAVALASCTALFLPVEDRIPTTIELAPADVVLRDQETVELSLTVRDQHGVVMDSLPPSLPVRWSVSDPDRGFVHAGRLKGEKQGEGWVVVEVGDLSTASRFRVLGVPRFLRSGEEPARTGVVGLPLPTPAVVRVVDRVGAGVAEVEVTFRVTAGAGTVSDSTVMSDTAGYARTVWTLGVAPGINGLEARVDSLRGEVVRFTSTGSAGAVTRLDRIAGDQQRGAAGAVAAQELVIRALDRNGNRVAGATVDWSTETGSLLPVSTTTDTAGIARARWRLGTVAGQQEAAVRVGAAEAWFAASAVPGAPARLVVVGGNNQGAAEYRTLRDSLAVRVSDEHDNPVQGVTVAWEVTRGGGSIAVSGPATTRVDGVARARWTLGLSLPNAATAAAGGRTVAFTATAIPLVPRDTIRTTSGLRFLEVDLSSDSLVVRAGDLVSVYFSAFLQDGTLVDRVEEAEDSPLRFVVGAGQVIRGFDEGVLGMRTGSLRRRFLTPELGYRDGTMDFIPPNSTLVFDVRLTEVLRLEDTSSSARLPLGAGRAAEALNHGDKR